MPRATSFALVALMVVAGACGEVRAGHPVENAPQPSTAPPSAVALTFRNDIVPIFERRHCSQCHSVELGSYELLLGLSGWCQAGTVEGTVELPYIEPGDPSRSLLWRRLLSSGPEIDFERSCGFPMPADATGPTYGLEELWPADFAVIEAWIETGAAE